ncbi:MAG: hypothetical protein Kow0098_26050 [Ignavibacteriaceae bacterium]
MNRLSHLLLVLVELLFITGNFSAQCYDKDFSDYLNRFYHVKNVPSVSAGVLKDDRIIFSKSIGYADLENFVKADENTIYRIASISKMITAVAVMQLVEKGKINLDEDIRTYIPYFPKKKWKVTTRQLLNHTSGIRNYRNGEFESTKYFTSIREAINVVSSDSLRFKPGTQFLYSSLSYNLLAGITEAVSGTNFNQYLKENIFLPAEMYNTYPDIQHDIIRHRARGYEVNELGEIQNAPLADLSIKYPGGGYISTVTDLLRFASALLQNKLISKASLDTMMVKTKLNNGSTINYGLGVSVEQDQYNRIYISHAGTGTGFSSLLVIYPVERIAAVHLINIKRRIYDSPALQLASIALGSGYSPPLISIADYLLKLYKPGKIDSVISALDLIIDDSSDVYSISTDELSQFGHGLIRINRIYDAIIYFRYISDTFPDYSGALTGLADAYLKDGNRGMALKHFRLALKINPADQYAAEMIRKITSH